MLGTILAVLLASLAVLVLLGLGLRLYVCLRFLPTIVRIFEEVPFFSVLAAEPAPDAEELSFPTSDGLTLRGSYWPTTAPERIGVILFCHEFSSRRWSCRHYCGHLRDSGYDIFTFDFRNHGESDALEGYEPLQWVTEYEVADVNAALRYLRQRDDISPRGVGIYGMSKGGAAALAAAAHRNDVAAIVTDGAFPTHGMQVVYMRRWVAIYSQDGFWLERLGVWLERTAARWMPPISPWRPNTQYDLLARTARRISERRRNCRFVDVEGAVERLGCRPWLMIQGERDSYVLPEVARELFRYAGSRSKLWIVPMAKHNKSIQVAAQRYRKELCGFFDRYLGASRRKAIREPLGKTDREPLAAPVSRGD